MSNKEKTNIANFANVGIKEVSLVLCFGCIILIYNVASSIRLLFDDKNYSAMIVTIAITILLFFVIRKSWSFAINLAKEEEKKEKVKD